MQPPQAQREAQLAGVPLAADLAAVAASEGLRLSVLKTYGQYLQARFPPRISLQRC